MSVNMIAASVLCEASAVTALKILSAVRNRDRVNGAAPPVQRRNRAASARRRGCADSSFFYLRVNLELEVTKNVEREHMRNFELDLFLTFRSHLGSPQDARRANTLKFAAKSREESASDTLRKSRDSFYLSTRELLPIQARQMQVC